MSSSKHLTDSDYKKFIEEIFEDGKRSIINNEALKSYIEYKYCIPSLLDEQPFNLDTLVHAVSYYGNEGYKGPYVLFVTKEEMNYIFTNEEFSDLLDPVSKYEVIQTGKIGKILNIEIYTDAFLTPDLHYIDKVCLRFKANAKMVETTS